MYSSVPTTVPESVAPVIQPEGPTGRRRGRGRRRLATARFEPRDAEVHDERVAGPVNHDVGGLQVAMDDAGLVRRLQAGGDLPRDPQRLRYRQLAARVEERRQAPPVDVRHRDVLGAVDLAEVVDAHDVLVRHLARQQQLALEPVLEFRRHRRSVPGPDDLDGHGDAELGVPRLVDRAHAADAELPHDPVAGAERMAGDQQTFAAALYPRGGRHRGHPQRASSHPDWRLNGRSAIARQNGPSGVRFVR